MFLHTYMYFKIENKNRTKELADWFDIGAVIIALAIFNNVLR